MAGDGPQEGLLSFSGLLLPKGGLFPLTQNTDDPEDDNWTGPY